MIKCPYCESIFGYYRKVCMKGRGKFTYSFDGSRLRNDDLHDGIEYRESKTCYCVICDKKLKI